MQLYLQVRAEMVELKKLKDILLPIDSTSVLEKMNPNFFEIAKLSKAMNCIGIHSFSVINTAELTAICRNFAPLYGINEESATGTSNCALVMVPD